MITIIRTIVVFIFIGQLAVIRLLRDMRGYARTAHDKAQKAEQDAADAINIAETQLRVGTGLRNPLRPE